MHNVYASFIHPIKIAPKEELYMDAEQSSDYNKQIKDLKYIRGHFLELIIFIEERVNYIIEQSLIPKKSKLKTVFQEMILHSRNLSLKTKIDLFYEIIKIRREMKEAELNDLYKGLEILVIERNKWAHGPIFFQQKKVDGKLKLQSYLNYINSKGQFAEEELTNKYFDDIDKKLNLIIGKLTHILVKRKLLPKEDTKKK